MLQSFSFPTSFITAFSFFSFLVTADVSPYNNSVDYNKDHFGSHPVQTYISNPDIVAPIANILTAPQYGVSPSEYILWSPVIPDMSRTGPMILDAKTLALVYQGPAFDNETIGGTVQTCNGTDYITWWSGQGVNGRKAGKYFMLSANYTNTYNVSAVGDLRFGDAHEFFLTPHCTAVFTSYQAHRYNLTHYGLENGYLLDSYFQEVDITTNELLFEWNASDHVNVSDSYLTPKVAGQGSPYNAFDFFHINSIEKDDRGNYLVSSRHMRSLYYVNGISGEVIWTLGGRQNQFTDLNGNATNFAWQHHARWTSSDLRSISLYDNKNSRYETSADPISRGIIISLNYTTMSATLNASYSATSNIKSTREGSMQLLPGTNGNVLLGYGNEPGFTEFSANGTILWDVRFGPLGLDRKSADNYRALKVNWTGTPTWSPSIAAGPADAITQLFKSGKSLQVQNTTNDTAYISWNGATEVVKWVILAANDTSVGLNTTSKIWKEVMKTGFESKVQVGEQSRYVRALAVDTNGKTLNATPVLDMQTGETSDEPFDSEAYNESESNILSIVWKSVKKIAQHMQKHGHLKIIAGVLGGLSGILIIGLGVWAYCRRQQLAKVWKQRSGGNYSNISLDGEEAVERSRVSDKSTGTVVITPADVVCEAGIGNEHSDDDSDFSIDDLEKSGLVVYDELDFSINDLERSGLMSCDEMVRDEMVR